MTDPTPTTDDPHAASDVRALRISFVSGAVLGAIFGTTRYGFFSFSNIAMVGLGIITTVFLHALWVLARPARA